MRCIIVGAGAVGRHLCAQLSLEGHEVVLIDRDIQQVRRAERDFNIMAVEGNGASASILQEAGIEKADLFVAVTNIDEVNLMACILAKEFGVARKIARVRNEEYLSATSPLNEHRLGIDLIINPDQAMTNEILKISEISEAFEVVDLADGQAVLVGYAIRESSPVCGINLSDLKDLRGLYDFVVVAIVRDEATIIPRGGDRILPGDKFYIVMSRREMAAVEELLGLRSKAPKRVFIIGGGEVGLRVAKALESQKVEVLMVESDEARCELLADTLQHTIVLNIDGLDAHDLVAEGVDTADLVIAVTESDTTNILATLLAKHHGAKKSIIRISRPDFIPLLGRLGIDVALSGRLVAANMILKFIRKGAVSAAASLLGSDAEVVEFRVNSRWPYEGRPLQDVDFPAGINVGAVVRSGEVIIPSGSTMLEAGDRLIIFATREAVPPLEKLFAP